MTQEHKDSISQKLTGVKRDGPRSEKQMKQIYELIKSNANNVEIQKKKSASMSKLKWCHDPNTKINMRLENVPEGWIVGKYGESSIGGSTTWNDGVKSYRVKKDETPREGWVRGMVPRKGF